MAQGRVHKVKSHPASFEAIWSGRRPFDVRRDDRAYLRGDVLVLQEWDPALGRHTGREMVARVTDVWSDWHLVGVEPRQSSSTVAHPGVVVMAITVASWRGTPAQPHTVQPEALV